MVSINLALVYCKYNVRYSVLLINLLNVDFFATDPTYVIGLFPDLLPIEFRKQLEYPAPPPPLTPGELEKGCLALLEYLTQVKT